jgi:hypothetical protein
MLAWVEQILRVADANLELVRVPDHLLPPDLALLGAPAQHLLADIHQAEQLLAWTPGDPTERVTQSVRWHLKHPPNNGWSDADTEAERTALAALD